MTTSPEHELPIRIFAEHPEVLLALLASRGIELGAVTLVPESEDATGPASVPWIASAEDALRSPDLALLSVMAHGKSAAGEAIARAALVGAASLDDEKYRLYTDRILEAPRAGRVEQAGGRDEGRSDPVPEPALP